jgi:hypothetical protein
VESVNDEVMVYSGEKGKGKGGRERGLQREMKLDNPILLNDNYTPYITIPILLQSLIHTRLPSITVTTLRVSHSIHPSIAVYRPTSVHLPFSSLPFPSLPLPLPLPSSPSMHGRLKTSVQASEEEAAVKRTQISKYIAAKDLFLHRRHAQCYDEKSRELTGKLIELNPDLYTLWNMRKEIVLHIIDKQSAQQRETTGEGNEGRKERDAMLCGWLSVD